MVDQKLPFCYNMGIVSKQEQNMAYNATKEIKELADTLSKEWNLPISEFYTEEIEYIGMIVQVCNDDVREVLGLAPVDH